MARALRAPRCAFFCAFLLLAAAAWPSAAGDAAPLTTMLLVARSELPDPNFKDAVVLVMNNVAPGPAGIIINRPTRLSVSHVFPDAKGLERVADKVYFGGPVEIESISFLFRTKTPPDGAILVVQGVYLSKSAKLLRELLARDKPMDGLRIFVGHSGWAPGQLENEISRGDWKLAPASVGAIFDPSDEHPWPEQSTPGDLERT
jgi:putative transcriptional regulator